MNEVYQRRRLPRSIRKHVRQEKARLRRLLPPAEARRAIDQLLHRFRRGAETPAVGATAGKAGKRVRGLEEPTREHPGAS